MKKLCLLLVVFTVGAAGVFALDFDILRYPPPVGGGSILVDLGLGFTSAEAGKLSVPPLRVSAEYALPVEVPVSVGGLFAFHSTKDTVSNRSYGYSYLTFGARGNWHWGLDVPWLDLYTGLFLGYQVVSYDLPSGAPEPSYGGFVPGGQLGAHFYFTQMLGAFVEFGYPYWGSLGLALKF
jgi:hypothetical protein